MLNFRKAEQENLYQSAFEKIDQLYYLLNGTEFLRSFNLTIPNPCYTNFKDALFHYHKIINLDDRDAIFDQFYAISEHVSRARNDYYLIYLSMFSYALEKLILDCAATEDEKKLRKALHDIKTCSFSIRYGGMRIISFYNKVNDEDFNACIQQAIDTVKELRLTQKFMEYVISQKEVIEEKEG